MLTFVPGTLSPLTGQYVRRVGRPRNEWAVMLHREYCKMGAGRSTYIEQEWREAVCQHIIMEYNCLSALSDFIDV